MDCDEPHLMLNEKTQPIQRPTGALVAAGSLWPWAADMETGPKLGWLALRKPLAHKSPQGSGRHGIWKPCALRFQLPT